MIDESSIRRIAKIGSRRAHLTNGYSPVEGVTRTYCRFDIADRDRSYLATPYLPTCKICAKIQEQAIKNQEGK